MRIVGCFLQYQDKFVILHRHSHKTAGDTWGVPSGKIEDGETDDNAILRELYEETGYRAAQNELKLLGVFDCLAPSGKVIQFVTYRVMLKEPHQVKLETSAHQDYCWVTAQEYDVMPDIIFGMRDVMRWTGYLPEATV